MKNGCKQWFAIFLTVLLVVGLTPISAFAVKDQAITTIAVKDILDPMDGQKLDLDATVAAPTKYTVKSLLWSEYDADLEWSRDMESGDTYVKGNYYFVFVTLEAKSGYYFPAAAQITATVNGSNANKYSPRDEGKTIQIYYCFDICKKNIARVDLTIVKPVIGKTPTFGRVNTAEYESKNTGGVSNQTNGVTWTNQVTGVNLTVSNPFKADGKYTVKYYLTAKENYWFNGTKYYINGQEVQLISSNGSRTEVVVGLTDLIPGDGKTVISTLDLSVVAPKDGEKPNYTKVEGVGYYSDNGLNGTSTKIFKNGIAWYKSASSYITPGTTEPFVGGSEYTVKISLTPKDGYKFAGSVTAKINGKTATVEAFDDGSITVSVKLTAVKKDHVHTAGSAWQSDESAHWRICSDQGCGSMVGEKQSHADANRDGKCDTCAYVLPTQATTTTTQAADTTTQPTGTKAPVSGTTTAPSERTNTVADATEATVETTQPTEAETVDTPAADGNVENEGDDGESNSGILWIVLGVVAVLAAAAVAIVILLKKKNAK